MQSDSVMPRTKKKLEKKEDYESISYRQHFKLNKKTGMYLQF